MIFFTGDWHLGEKRIGINGEPNVYYRPFISIDDQDRQIMAGLYSSFKDGDTLWHLGDVINGDVINGEKMLKEMVKRYPNSIFNLIIGNHDENKIEMLSKYFNVLSSAQLPIFCFGSAYLNHYPTKTLEKIGNCAVGITGHIHGLWKVQRKLINVGVDAWSYLPVSKEQIEFCYNGMEKYYDNDVFPYEPKRGGSLLKVPKGEKSLIYIIMNNKITLAVTDGLGNAYYDKGITIFNYNDFQFNQNTLIHSDDYEFYNYFDWKREV